MYDLTHDVGKNWLGYRASGQSSDENATAELARITLESKKRLAGEGALIEPSRFEADAHANAVRCMSIVNAIEAERRPDGPEPFSIVELGLGYGYVTTALSWWFGQTAELSAVDHPDAGVLPPASLDAYLEERDVTYGKCDLLSDPLPWAEERFDVAVLSEVIEHLPPTEVPAMLERIVPSIAPGGELVVSSPNLHSALKRGEFLLGRGPLFETPVGQAPSYGHIVLYGKDDMARLLKHVGFEIVRFDYTNWQHIFVPVDRPSKRAQFMIQKHVPRLMPSLSTSWTLVARRAGETG